MAMVILPGMRFVLGPRSLEMEAIESFLQDISLTVPVHTTYAVSSITGRRAKLDYDSPELEDIMRGYWVPEDPTIALPPHGVTYLVGLPLPQSELREYVAPGSFPDLDISKLYYSWNNIRVIDQVPRGLLLNVIGLFGYSPTWEQELISVSELDPVSAYERYGNELLMARKRWLGYTDEDVQLARGYVQSIRPIDAWFPVLQRGTSLIPNNFVHDALLAEGLSAIVPVEVIDDHVLYKLMGRNVYRDEGEVFAHIWNMPNPRVRRRADNRAFEATALVPIQEAIERYGFQY